MHNTPKNVSFSVDWLKAIRMQSCQQWFPVWLLTNSRDYVLIVTRAGLICLFYLLLFY